MIYPRPVHPRSLLLVITTLACAAPPERPLAPPPDPAAELYAAHEQELTDLRCAELVDYAAALSPRGVEKLAGLLLQRCIEPAPANDSD